MQICITKKKTIVKLNWFFLTSYVHVLSENILHIPFLGHCMATLLLFISAWSVACATYSDWLLVYTSVPLLTLKTHQPMQSQPYHLRIKTNKSITFNEHNGKLPRDFVPYAIGVRMVDLGFGCHKY